jgi:hypothetical protein
MRFLEELKRRHVFRAAIGYLIGSWIVIQVSDIMLFNFSAAGWDLKLRPGFREWFGDITENQDILDTLQ